METDRDGAFELRDLAPGPHELDFGSSLCSGSSDGEGRLRLSNVPFGPTRLTVQLSTATWSNVVSIPIAGRSLRVDIPSQAISVRVARGDTGAPVAGANVGWKSAQGTVRARATAAGDVLLDGVPPGPGRLSVRAEGFPVIERQARRGPCDGLGQRLRARRNVHGAPAGRGWCHLDDAAAQPALNLESCPIVTLFTPHSALRIPNYVVLLLSSAHAFSFAARAFDSTS